MFHLQTLLLLLRSQCKGDVFTIFRFLVIPLSEHSEFKKWGSSHLKMKNFSGEGPRTPPPLFWTQVKSAPGKSLGGPSLLPLSPLGLWSSPTMEQTYCQASRPAHQLASRSVIWSFHTHYSLTWSLADRSLSQPAVAIHHQSLFYTWHNRLPLY